MPAQESVQQNDQVARAGQAHRQRVHRRWGEPALGQGDGHQDNDQRVEQAVQRGGATFVSEGVVMIGVAGDQCAQTAHQADGQGDVARCGGHTVREVGGVVGDYCHRPGPEWDVGQGGMQSVPKMGAVHQVPQGPAGRSQKAIEAADDVLDPLPHRVQPALAVDGSIQKRRTRQA